MRAKKILSCILAMVLLASAVPMAVTPAAAYEKKIPCDADENNELTKDELVNAILPYMLDEGDFTLDEVGDAAYVYAYWDGKPKTIVDSEDKEVTICRPIERIACTLETHIDILRLLKVPKETIVGVPGYIYKKSRGCGILYPEFSEVPQVSQKDVESILNLHPDAVVYYSFHGLDPAATCDTYEAAGVTLLVFSGYKKPDDYKLVVRAFGYIHDNEDEAEDYIDWRENFLNAIKERVEENIPEENRTRVYYEGGWGSHPAIGTYIYNSHLIAAGGVNIFSDLPEYSEVDFEELVKRNPEVIVNQARGGGYGVDDISALRAERDWFMDEPLLKDVAAVKDGRVYTISNDICCCGASSKYFLAIGYMAKWFYPELFDELDPLAFHQEYLTRFQGLDYDLNKRGTFVYHPEQFPEGK